MKKSKPSIILPADDGGLLLPLLDPCSFGGLVPRYRSAAYDATAFGAMVDGGRLGQVVGSVARLPQAGVVATTPP